METVVSGNETNEAMVAQNDGSVTAKFAVTLPSHVAVTTLRPKYQSVAPKKVTDDRSYLLFYLYVARDRYYFLYRQTNVTNNPLWSVGHTSSGNKNLSLDVSCTRCARTMEPFGPKIIAFLASSPLPL